MLNNYMIASLALLLASQNVLAKPLNCSNDRIAKSWLIDQGRIIMQGETKGSRDVASSLNEIRSFRTQLTSEGVSRVIIHNGMKYSIHVNNIKAPSELDDYVAIKNSDGHEVIYPLNCQ